MLKTLIAEVLAIRAWDYANAMETKQFYIGSFELLRSCGRFKRLLLETNQPSGFSDFSISRIVSVPGSGIAASTDGTTQSNRSSLCWASAMSKESVVRPQLTQKCSRLAGFHLTSECFIGAALGYKRPYETRIRVENQVTAKNVVGHPSVEISGTRLRPFVSTASSANLSSPC